ncbi:6-phosphogluconate dehydratase [Mesoplasma entomophilum]|uniref:6-phosphogluconate dehydratase n=1 Tax=Mesoplasma entomophilum TaxID=2149 RepID=A0A3S5Y0J8_9MOLU|nr:DegV family protein [Mesoplasma entomophilum]ATQ35769.1 6-phosphogluconate dehydratase [Mesoplasma entomophilum]ATZ19738.1 fatty acid-binding protein DegV [Mesoplasma entomophilum]AVN60586.1 6-phosphogluconate dehydratase [Mesoplasma entomophilum]
MKIAILTDSSFDGNLKSFKDLYQVPLLIVEEDGTTHFSDDKLDDNFFYDLLDKQILKTAQTTPGEMLKVWDKLLTEYDQIIFLPLSKGLSGQFSTYRMISETEKEYKGKVFVCDTNGVSIVNQEFVKKVAFWIAQNKKGFEIMELVSKSNEDFIGYIIPKSLDTLKRGGRISPAAASLAKMLKIVPILRYDGKIDKEATARTFKKAINEALDLIKKNAKGVKTVDISYSRMEPETLAEIVKIIEEKGFTINLKSQITSVIAAHTGKETLAIAAWKK